MKDTEAGDSYELLEIDLPKSRIRNTSFNDFLDAVNFIILYCVLSCFQHVIPDNKTCDRTYSTVSRFLSCPFPYS